MTYNKSDYSEKSLHEFIDDVIGGNGNYNSANGDLMLNEDES